MRYRLRALGIVFAGSCAAGVAASAAADAGPMFQALVMSSPARVRIAAGWFTMGSDADDLARALRTCQQVWPGAGECNPDMFEDERPARRVHVQAFAIDRTEVSHAAYRRCVAAGKCYPAGSSETDARIGLAEHPVVQIDWEQARNYCRFVAGDLPSEAQWEFAARGTSKRQFPWGELWNDRLANHAEPESTQTPVDGYRYAAPVDSFPDGKSFFGLRNMAGNVWEFVLDRYAGPYSTQDSRIDPTGASSGSERVIRGGSWRSASHTLRASYRAHMPASEARPDVGFRCAYPR